MQQKVLTPEQIIFLLIYLLHSVELTIAFFLCSFTERTEDFGEERLFVANWLITASKEILDTKVFETNQRVVFTIKTLRCGGLYLNNEYRSAAAE